MPIQLTRAQPQRAEDVVKVPIAGNQRRLLPFVIMRHPWQWVYIESEEGKPGDLVPRIEQQPADPGVGGTPQPAPGHKVDTAQRIAALSARKWLLIDPFDARLRGTVGEGYTCTVPAEGGRVLHCAPWDVPEVTPGSSRVRWRVDMAMYLEFCRIVAKWGDRCSEAAWLEIERGLEEIRDRRYRAATTSDLARQRYEAAEAKLTRAREVWAKYAADGPKVAPVVVSPVRATVGASA